ncbi:hypothetical protein DFA_04146 [Cavenderia fasciculata]|uniref:Transmembrane protein n=1 Tax=Cavenderia fasciculata TaxID=261658 RepID=F4Q1F0_CACFS|nr:uncharacterized protein DFA_04146 [Cavenderia fasciculata]EGG18651.1 hypothetical protein DFA_04146 [Cavenderia fasciculata]|eukprot:XP_004366555.1 hypothetical protein DFA_04146 [Cavenderia fasciculata]
MDLDILIHEVSTHRKKSNFYDVSTVGRVFILLVLLEFIGTLVLFGLSYTTWSNYFLLYIYIFLILIYFSIQSVRKKKKKKKKKQKVLNENKYLLINFIIVQSIVSAVEIYHFFAIQQDRDLFHYIRVGAIISFIPLNYILAWFTNSHFGWRIFRKVGTSIELRRWYKSYQVFLSSIKLDLFLTGLFYLALSFFYFIYSFDYYLNLLSFLISLIWSIGGVISIREENRELFICFMVLSICIPGYAAWKLFTIVELILNNVETFQMAIPIALFCILMMLGRLILIKSSFTCRFNFSKGLKVVFDKEQKQQQSLYNI